MKEFWNVVLVLEDRSSVEYILKSYDRVGAARVALRRFAEEEDVELDVISVTVFREET